MKRLATVILLFGILGLGSGLTEGKPILELGRWNVCSLEKLILEAKKISDSGERVIFISEKFLGTKYGRTNIGRPNIPEKFVANLREVDCVTILEYILALTNAENFQNWLDKLQIIRYQDGLVSYQTRNHYMINWLEENSKQGYISDITTSFPFRSITKKLCIVQGIEPQIKVINYIPRDRIEEVEFKNGDFIFFATGQEGLDVSHCGLIVIKNGIAYLRHAKWKKNFRDEGSLKIYLEKQSKVIGLIIARPNI